MLVAPAVEPGPGAGSSYAPAVVVPINPATPSVPTAWGDSLPATTETPTADSKPKVSKWNTIRAMMAQSQDPGSTAGGEGTASRKTVGANWNLLLAQLVPQVQQRRADQQQEAEHQVQSEAPGAKREGFLQSVKKRMSLRDRVAEAAAERRQQEEEAAQDEALSIETFTKAFDVHTLYQGSPLEPYVSAGTKILYRAVRRWPVACARCNRSGIPHRRHPPCRPSQLPS